MIHSPAAITAAIETVEHLADLDPAGNYAPMLDRLERELRAARRQQRSSMAAGNPPENTRTSATALI